MSSDVNEEDLLRSVPIRVTDDGDAWELLQLGAVARLGSISLQARPASFAARGGSSHRSDASAIPDAPPTHNNNTSSSSSAILSLLSSGTTFGAASSNSNNPSSNASGATASDAANGGAIVVNCNSVEARFYVSGRLDETSFDMLNNTALAFNWYKRPYVHVFAVHHALSSAPAGSAKDISSGVRRRLKQFVDTCLERKVVYMVLFVASSTVAEGNNSNSGAAAAAQRRFFATSATPYDPEVDLKMARRAFDKLRSIANVVRGREHCVFVRAPPSPAPSSSATTDAAAAATSTSSANTENSTAGTFSSSFGYATGRTGAMSTSSLSSLAAGKFDRENNESKHQQEVLSLPPPPHATDFLQRLGDCVTEALQARVAAYEDEIDRVYANRMLPGWSFFTYFALKESLNFVYRQVGCFELALCGYDGLEEMVYERRDSLGASSFIARSAKQVDDSARALVDLRAKDFRRRVYESTISEMDFRVYLFARQNELLMLKGQLPELAERGLRFIEQLAAMISERVSPEATLLGSSFRDAWVFSASRQLAAELEAKVRGVEIDDGVLVEENDRRTARLVAGFHVTALQAFSSLAVAVLQHAGATAADSDPHEILDSMPTWAAARSAKGEAGSSESPPNDKPSGFKRASTAKGAPSPRSSLPFSNSELQRSLRSPAAAEQLFTELAFAAASLFELGGRGRGAAALGGEAGVVRLQSGSYTQAESLLSLQCARYLADDGWDALHHRSRAALAFAEKTLGKAQEFLLSCLAMIIMYRDRRRQRVRSMASASVSSAQQHGQAVASSFREIGELEDATRWAAEAAEAAAHLPRVMKYKLDRLVDASMLPSAMPWKQGNPACATVVIMSDIPATLRFDSLAVELRFVAPAAELGPSDSMSAVDSPASAQNHPLKRGSSSAVAAASNIGSLFALTHRELIEIKHGRNEVTVQAQEVPYSGKYEVSLIVFYLGKLKLVQIAESWRDQIDACSTGACMSAAGAFPSVDDHISELGSTTGKSTTIDVPPFSKPGGVQLARSGLLLRFPSYFATGHERSFVVNVPPQHVLLAPYAVQYVNLELVAGDRGVASGATLSLALQLPRDQTFISEVTLVDTSTAADSEQPAGATLSAEASGTVARTLHAEQSQSHQEQEQPELLVVQSGGFGCNHGTATLSTSLAPNEVKVVRVAIAFGALVPQSLVTPSGALVDEHLEIECVLNIEVMGWSLDEPNAFKFRHRSFGAVRVSSVVLVSASIVHHIVKFAPGGAVGEREPSVEDEKLEPKRKGSRDAVTDLSGGVLLCEIESCSSVAPSRRLTLYDATLELAPPYSLKTGGASHALVLPCELDSRASFSLCFGFSNSRGAVEAPVDVDSGGGIKSALLRLELEADRVDGRVVIERSIPISALDRSRSYVAVERRAMAECCVGEPLSFAFRVHLHEPQRCGFERASSIEYELDLGDSVWLVAGKAHAHAPMSQRATVIDDANVVRRRSTRWTRLKLVGMLPGHHPLPRVRLLSLQYESQSTKSQKQQPLTSSSQRQSSQDPERALQLMFSNAEYRDNRSSVCILPEKILVSTCLPESRMPPIGVVESGPPSHFVE